MLIRMATSVLRAHQHYFNLWNIISSVDWLFFSYLVCVNGCTGGHLSTCANNAWLKTGLACQNVASGLWDGKTGYILLFLAFCNLFSTKHTCFSQSPTGVCCRRAFRADATDTGAHSGRVLMFNHYVFAGKLMPVHSKVWSQYVFERSHLCSLRLHLCDQK